jgi:hypothetical protein
VHVRYVCTNKQDIPAAASLQRSPRRRATACLSRGGGLVGEHGSSSHSHSERRQTRAGQPNQQQPPSLVVEALRPALWERVRNAASPSQRRGGSETALDGGAGAWAQPGRKDLLVLAANARAAEDPNRWKPVRTDMWHEAKDEHSRKVEEDGLAHWEESGGKVEKLPPPPWLMLQAETRYSGSSLRCTALSCLARHVWYVTLSAS